MGGRRSAVDMLPRLVPGDGRAAAVCNAAGLPATALVGAGLVHVLAYHLPLGIPFGPRWGAVALDLLVHCPLLGPLGLVVAIAVLAPLLALHEVLRLQRLNAALAALMAARHAPLPPAREPIPRSPWRLAGFAVVLLGMQVALLGLAGLVRPMQITMVMGGAAMTMPLMPALPLGPLHVLIAALCALLLWRMECRLTRLRAEVARRLRLLSGIGARTHVPLLHPRAARLPRGWHGHVLFARPPPSAA